MGIGLGDLLICFALLVMAICVIVGAAYATILWVRKKAW